MLIEDDQTSALRVRVGCPDFLGAFSKLPKVTISLVTSVRLSFWLSTWNSSATTERIFMKFDTWGLLEKTVEKIPVSLKSDKNNGYFTWRSVYVYNSGDVAVNSS
jgi:hypothetical protein